MPTDVKFRPRPSRAAVAFDSFLVLARWCLVCVAVSLATLIFVQLQIVSWRIGEVDQGVPPELELTITSP
jgi:hypothetical protein